jgi:hypothetical protein
VRACRGCQNDHTIADFNPNLGQAKSLPKQACRNTIDTNCIFREPWLNRLCNQGIHIA